MNKIQIIDRTTEWICCEKPAGMSVHNDPGKDLISLLSKQTAPGEILQPVHRLDRETSGLILMATRPESLARLSAAFAGREIKKHYFALVHGMFGTEPQGIWDWSLSRQAGGRKDPRGRGKKQAAKTRYQVLEQSLHYALLEIELFTGKKHQIRRHARLSGHPVVGDARYGSPRAITFLKENKGFSRMALHACRLCFRDNKTPVAIDSPLPKEIRTLLAEDL